MINLLWVAAVFVLTFAASFLVYYHHYDTFVKYHSYSLVVDVLVWIGATLTILAGIFFYDTIPKFNYLLWFQMVFAMCSLNIHLVRFFIGLSRKRTKTK